MLKLEQLSKMSELQFVEVDADDVIELGKKVTNPCQVCKDLVTGATNARVEVLPRGGKIWQYAGHLCTLLRAAGEAE